VTASIARRYAFLAPAFAACLSFAPALAARNGCDQIAEQAALDQSDPPPSVPVREIVERKTQLVSFFSELAIDGFLDLRTTSARADGETLSSGHFELNVAKEMGERVAFSATLAANAEGTSLAAGVVDVRLVTRGEGGSGGQLDLRVGRFDVPFGNDWRSFAANDRTELSAPLTTDAIMDGGHNDTGIQVFGRRRAIEASAGVMRGSRAGTVYSGRLAVAPFETQGEGNRVEGGLSLLVIGRGRDTETNAIAVDAEARAGAWRIRAEHVRKRDRSLDTTTERTGWHFTAAVDAGNVLGVALTPFARFDSAGEVPAARLARAGRRDVTHIRRTTAGVRADLSRVLILKVEYTRILAAPSTVRASDGFHSDSLMTQFVIAF
jgi:hypothetical protein